MGTLFGQLCEVNTLLSNVPQLALFRLPSGFVGNDVKSKDTRGTLWYPLIGYPLPLTPFPQSLQPLPLRYESVPPRITDLIESLFFLTPGSVWMPFWILQLIPIKHEVEIQDRFHLTHPNVNLPTPLPVPLL